MSNCSTLTLCDPNTGAKVLVTNPGTADAAGFELPSGTPYAGDLSALVKCADGGGEVLDCEGAPIAATDRVVTWEQLTAYDRGHVVPFIDSGDGCTPAPIADCPADIIATTINDSGDTYQWDGTAWTLRAVSPQCTTEFAQGLVTTLGDAELDAAPNAFVAYETLELPITNDDCVPWCVNFRVRSHSRLAAPNGTRAAAQIVTGANNTAAISWDGSPLHEYDYRFSTAGVIRNAYGDMYRWARQRTKVQPGQTITAAVDFEYRIYSYNSNPNSALTLGNNLISADIDRCMP